jgi:hypothetical protein
MGDAAQPGDAAGAPPAVAGPGLQAPALAGPGLQAPALDLGLQAPALPELEGDLGDIVMSEGTPDELIAALKRAGITTVADLELFKGENGGPLDWAQSSIVHLQSTPGNEGLANSLAHKVSQPE